MLFVNESNEKSFRDSGVYCESVDDVRVKRTTGPKAGCLMGTAFQAISPISSRTSVR